MERTYWIYPKPTAENKDPPIPHDPDRRDEVEIPHGVSGLTAKSLNKCGDCVEVILRDLLWVPKNQRYKPFKAEEDVENFFNLEEEKLIEELFKLAWGEIFTHFGCSGKDANNNPCNLIKDCNDGKPLYVRIGSLPYTKDRDVGFSLGITLVRKLICYHDATINVQPADVAPPPLKPNEGGRPLR